MSTPKPDTRPRQAFILGWAFTHLGGVSEVVRSLVHEYELGGALAPLVVEPRSLAEAAGVGKNAQHDSPLRVQFSFPTPYNRRSPLRAMLGFVYRLPPLFARLYELCKTYNVKVLNPHFIGLEYFGLMLFRRSGLFRGKLLFSFHGSDLRSMMGTKGLARFLARIMLRGADLLIPCSDGLAGELLMFVPECSRRVVAIPNGIAVDRFLHESDRPLPLPNRFAERRKVISIGAFEFKKAHDVLLAAFAQVREQHQDVCLIIAGEKKEKFDETGRLTGELELTEDVLLLHNIAHSQISALLRWRGIFVLSSHWRKGVCGEGFAMALLEAAAAGLPVVSTQSCGVSELIENGESGVTVPVEDPAQLATAICRLLDDGAEAERLAANLHRLVSEKFTWKAAHARYLQAIAAIRPSSGPLQPVLELPGEISR